MTEHELLTIIKRLKPYLYDYEMEVQKVIKETGFGDVSCSTVVRHGEVANTDIAHWVKRNYKT